MHIYAYIKVKRMVYLLDRSNFELGRDFCAAQAFQIFKLTGTALPELDRSICDFQDCSGLPRNRE
jgi:hypothetical protein